MWCSRSKPDRCLRPQSHGLVLLLIWAFLIGCQSPKSPTPTRSPEPAAAQPMYFFPVTPFIEGQIFELRQKALNPLKKTCTGKNMDSVWVKTEDFDRDFACFIRPAMDSAVLASLFRESRFMDESLGLITLTYDPLREIPDSIPWRQWTVYIDPESQEVKRIYMVRQDEPEHLRQLTWIPGSGCRSVTVFVGSSDRPGQSTEQEISYQWNF